MKIKNNTDVPKKVVYRATKHPRGIIDPVFRLPLHRQRGDNADTSVSLVRMHHCYKHHPPPTAHRAGTPFDPLASHQTVTQLAGLWKRFVQGWRTDLFNDESFFYCAD